MNLLPGHPLLSAHLASRTYKPIPTPMSLKSAHLIDYLLHSTREDRDCKHVFVIKDAAIALAQADTKGRTVQEFLTLLCPLAISKYQKHNLWTPNYYWSIYLPDGKYSIFRHELFIAALYTQVPSVVEDICQEHPWQWSQGYSDFFGNSYEVVTANADHHHLLKYLVLNGCLAGDTRRAFLRYAVEHCDLDMVKLIWEHTAVKSPWVFAQFPRESYEGHRNNRLLAKMHTPNVEVFEWLMEKRHEHCVGKTWGQEEWTVFLVRCAGAGWTEMARRYIELGVEVTGCDEQGRYIQASDGWLRHPLITAVSCGQRDIVELLLAHGARVCTYSLVAAVEFGDVDVAEMLLEQGIGGLDMRVAIELAVRKGHVRMVKILLGHCPDQGKMTRELVVHAVRLEHEQLFRFLLKTGEGLVAEHVREEWLRVCREDGLESMEKLLGEQ